MVDLVKDREEEGNAMRAVSPCWIGPMVSTSLDSVPLPRREGVRVAVEDPAPELVGADSGIPGHAVEAESSGT